MSLLVGCRAPAPAMDDSPGSEQLAVLVSPTAETRAELEQLIAAALNGTAITLEEHAFVRTSYVVIERGAQARDPSGNRTQGRELGRPDHFKLVTQQSRCTLVHDDSGKRWRLTKATCQPAT